VNPLDLPGPQFLVFYLVLCLLAMWTTEWLRRRQENGGEAPAPPDDPYLVAYLRGGHPEAARVAIASLLDRGLLKLEPPAGQLGRLRVVAAGPESGGQAQRPIEKEILELFRKPREAAAVLEGWEGSRAGEAYAHALRRNGLLPDARIRFERWQRALIALGICWGIAVAKILVALSRGRRNIGFLVIMVLLFTAVSLLWTTRRRTARGDRLLDHLQRLFGSLKDRAATLTPGGGSSELAWLAAVFGLGAVASPVFAGIGLFQGTTESRRQGKSDGSSTSCASTCGSGGSSCGSSCGGGCGGGCGGCGS